MLGNFLGDERLTNLDAPKSPTLPAGTREILATAHIADCYWRWVPEGGAPADTSSHLIRAGATVKINHSIAAVQFVCQDATGVIHVSYLSTEGLL